MYVHAYKLYDNVYAMYVHAMYMVQTKAVKEQTGFNQIISCMAVHAHVVDGALTTFGCEARCYPFDLPKTLISWNESQGTVHTRYKHLHT